MVIAKSTYTSLTRSTINEIMRDQKLSKCFFYYITAAKVTNSHLSNHNRIMNIVVITNTAAIITATLNMSFMFFG